jgi:hypothetical protein
MIAIDFHLQLMPTILATCKHCIGICKQNGKYEKQGWDYVGKSLHGFPSFEQE